MPSKILLIDDDPTLLVWLSKYLRSQGYSVLAAASGAEAPRLAYSEQPDLAIVDVMMPAMDGWELCARLRQKLETDPDHPAHIVTVRGFGYRIATAPLSPLEDKK